MIVKSWYVNNDVTRFVPRHKFEKKELWDKDIWARVNYGHKPPVEIKKVIGPEVMLGLDGRYITLEINPHSVHLVHGDMISIEEWDLYIDEIL